MQPETPVILKSDEDHPKQFSMPIPLSLNPRNGVAGIINLYCLLHPPKSVYFNHLLECKEIGGVDNL